MRVSVHQGRREQVTITFEGPPLFDRLESVEQSAEERLAAELEQPRPLMLCPDDQLVMALHRMNTERVDHYPIVCIQPGGRKVELDANRVAVKRELWIRDHLG
jgi:hypothetical protein